MPAEERTAFLYGVQHTFVKQRRRAMREELAIRHGGRGGPTKILLLVYRRRSYGAVIDAGLNAPMSPFREAVKASRRSVAAKLRRQSNSDESVTLAFHVEHRVLLSRQERHRTGAKSDVIRVQCFGASCASPPLSKRAKHQSLERRANARREQWNETPL